MRRSQGSYSQTLSKVQEIWRVIPHNYISNYAIRKHQAQWACYGDNTSLYNSWGNGEISGCVRGYFLLVYIAVLQRRMPGSQRSYSQTLWTVLEIWLVNPHNYIIIAYLCNYAIRKHQALNACYGEGLPLPLKSNMGTQQTGHSKRPPILNIRLNCDVLSWNLRMRYCRKKIMDNYTFLANCPPTPPLSQHFALTEK